MVWMLYPSNALVTYACADAVRRNPITCRATDAEVAVVVKEWLKHARDRDGGRARRTQQKHAAAAAANRDPVPPSP